MGTGLRPGREYGREGLQAGESYKTAQREGELDRDRKSWEFVKKYKVEHAAYRGGSVKAQPWRHEARGQGLPISMRGLEERGKKKSLRRKGHERNRISRGRKRGDARGKGIR